MNAPIPAPVVKRNRETVWFGLAERVLTDRGTLRLRLLWLRIILLLAFLLVGTWTAKTVGLYYFFKNVRNFEDVSLSSMIWYPVNRGEVRRNQGDYQVDQAFIALEEGDFRRALSLAQQGVARSPTNQKGRMLLIDIYSGWQPHLALQLLETGFIHAKGDVDYLRRYCQMLIMRREDAKVLELADEILPEVPLVNDYNKLLSIAAMRAAVMTGQYDRAASYFRDYHLDDTTEGIILAAELLTRLNQKPDAIRLLEQFAERYQQSDIDIVLVTLARYYRESDQLEKAVEVGITRSLKRPLEWQPRLDLLLTYDKMGAEERIQRELDALINQFRRDEKALAAIGQFATDLGKIDATRRIYEMALENNFSTAVFGLLYIEAHITAKQYSVAIAFFDELLKENPGWIAEYEPVFNSMRALAYHGINNREMGDLYLRECLNSRRITVPTLISVGQRFVKMGLLEPARQMLTEAHRRDPRNEEALARIIEVNLELGESRGMTEDVQQLLGLRRVSYSLMQRLYNELGSDRFIFTPAREVLIDELEVVLTKESSTKLQFQLRELPNQV